MKLETVRKNKNKIAIGIVIVIAILLIITILTSRAKYINSNSVEVVNGTVNHIPYDFKIMAMYKQKDDCSDKSDTNCYEEIDSMPTDYLINEELSYCTLTDKANKEEGITLKTNESGEHIIGNLQKGSKCYLYFEKKITSEDTLATLSPNLKVQAKIDKFTSIETATSTNKIYPADDEDGTTSYYFRGDVQDNYVKFGKTGTELGSGTDIWWRIIRINGDGSIRMIYAGTGSTVPNQRDGKATEIDSGTKYPYATENKLSNDNAYVGYYYTYKEAEDEKVRNGHETRSYAAENVEKWFEANLTDELNAGYIDRNAGFCTDRAAYKREGSSGNYTFTKDNNLGTGKTVTYYGAYIRNYPGQKIINSENPATPSFKCPDRTNDLFTMTGANQGTQNMTYPVGLITADEVTYAGGLMSTTNKSYYLYNGSGYWTMSPYDFSGIDARVFYVDFDGWLSNNNVYSTFELRPVINVAPGVLKNGTGESGNPYTI